MKRLVIVQPYVPGYRVPFFEQLIERLATVDVDCVVVGGQPHGAQAERGDSANASWMRLRRDWSIPAGRATLSYIGIPKSLSRSDGLILPAAGTSIDALRALAPFATSRRVGLWGHIKSYVAPPSRIDQAIEQWQMNRADRVFAYTPGGAAHALERGVPESKITTVMNSTDTSSLRRDNVHPVELDAFSSRHGLRGKTIFAFWGGLDSSKRIEFMADALDVLWELNQSVHVLVGGTGLDADMLARAARRGQVTLLGFITGREKVLLASIATAVVMPGRIGLIAVECLALGLPIVTTDWPYHAPEREYLEEGLSVISTADDPRVYAETLLSLARVPLANLPYPSLDKMVDNFAEGVQLMLD